MTDAKSVTLLTDQEIAAALWDDERLWLSATERTPLERALVLRLAQARLDNQAFLKGNTALINRFADVVELLTAAGFPNEEGMVTVGLRTQVERVLETLRLARLEIATLKDRS